jgi:hypothetical protein
LQRKIIPSEPFYQSGVSRIAGLPGISGSIGMHRSIEPTTHPVNRTGASDVGKDDAFSAPAPAYALELSGKSDALQKNAKMDSLETRQLKRTGKIECQTCKERKYQDGSNDPGVSFKAPGHISPESAGSVVMAHEQEHVSNEQAKAQNEDRRVVSQSVRIFTSVCPECGKVYVSGGETRTTTASEPKAAEQKTKPVGQQLDMKA